MSDPALSADLTTLDDHTSRLLATARALDDAARPSLCDGWTRGHVLTHLARNAEAIGRLADWATTGERKEMYPGGTAARDAAIEDGSRRGLPALRADLAATAAELGPRLSALQGDLAAAEVEMRGGMLVPGLRLPFLRLREVVYHHVDLDAGFAFADVEPPLVVRFVDDAVARLELGRHPPGLELHGDDGSTWRVGDGSARVDGTPAGLLLWLARRIPTGVEAGAGELPPLPRGA